jgi:hypothetical protein
LYDFQGEFVTVEERGSSATHPDTAIIDTRAMNIAICLFIRYADPLLLSFDPMPWSISVRIFQDVSCSANQVLATNMPEKNANDVPATC